jgi:hypothetical protein
MLLAQSFVSSLLNPYFITNIVQGNNFLIVPDALGKPEYFFKRRPHSALLYLLSRIAEKSLKLGSNGRYRNSIREPECDSDVLLEANVLRGFVLLFAPAERR